MKLFLSKRVVGVYSILTGLFVLSCSFAKEKKTPTTDLSTSVGTVNGKSVTLADLAPNEKSELFRTQKQLYELSQNLLANHYFETYIEEYKTKNKLASKEAARADFLAKNASVTDVEVTNFLKQNEKAPELQKIPEAERTKVIRDYLSRMSAGKAQQAILQDAIKQGKIVVSLTNLPPKEVFDFKEKGYEKLAGAKPKVTIVEFADYQCPYCVMAYKELKKIDEKYNANGSNAVQIVYYDFPLSFHPQATPASISAYCAAEQNKFWDMHDALYNRDPREEFDGKFIQKSAQTAKLDMPKYEKCLADSASKAQDLIKKHMDLAQNVGVQGTPSIYVNGERFEKGSNELDAAVSAILSGQSVN